MSDSNASVKKEKRQREIKKFTREQKLANALKRNIKLRKESKPRFNE